MRLSIAMPKNKAISTKEISLLIDFYNSFYPNRVAKQKSNYTNANNDFGKSIIKMNPINLNQYYFSHNTK